MSEDSNLKMINKIPSWNGDEATFGLYLSKVQAVSQLENVDVLDKDEMQDLPTKSEHEALGDTDADKALKEKFKLNKKFMATLIIGTNDPHTLSVLNKTKSDAHPYGVAHLAIAKLSSKHKPKDTNAEILLENAIDDIKFGKADDYLKEALLVQSQYSVELSETAMCKALLKKMKSKTDIQIVSKHLKLDPSQHDLETVIEEISEIQKLQKSACDAGNKSKVKAEKEISLAQTDDKPSGGGGNNSNSGVKCNACGGRHHENQCWRKHPEKAPGWFKERQKKRDEKKRLKQAETATSSVDMLQLASIDTASDFW